MRNLLWLVLIIWLFNLRLAPGHWAMLAGIVFLILVHELGHWIMARSLGIAVPVFSIGFGSSPRLVLGNLWGTEFQVTPWLAGGYVKIDPSDEEFSIRPIWQRAAVMSAGVIINYLVALGLVFLLFATTGQRRVEYHNIRVKSLSADVTAAKNAGIRVGDKIVSVDGIPIAAPADVKSAISKHSESSPASIRVERGGSHLDIHVIPQNGLIGVVMDGDTTVSYQRMSVARALPQSIDFCADMSGRMFQGLGALLHLVPLPTGLDGSSNVRGVIAIVQLGAVAFAEGVYSFAMMIAMISINLAILNALPIPVLDGGHLLFLAIEAIRGKPVSADVQAMASMVFFVLLLGVLALAIYNDLLHPILSVH